MRVKVEGQLEQPLAGILVAHAVGDGAQLLGALPPVLCSAQIKLRFFIAAAADKAHPQRNQQSRGSVFARLSPAPTAAWKGAKPMIYVISAFLFGTLCAAALLVAVDRASRESGTRRDGTDDSKRGS